MFYILTSFGLVLCELLFRSVDFEQKYLEENHCDRNMEDNKDPSVLVPSYRKQRRKRQKILVIDLFLDYAKNSTLHGLRYIAERGLAVIEKIFWLLTFLISIILCFLLIRNVWDKWRTSPVIVSFSEKLVPVGMVPFPSVTICPQIKSKASVYNFSQHYETYLQEVEGRLRAGNATENDYVFMDKFDDISMICGNSFGNKNYSKPIGDASVVTHIEEVSPKVKDVFLLCEWRSKLFGCDTVFRKVLTEEGVCYNVNALAAKELFNTDSIQNNYTYINTKKLSKGWNIDKGFINDDFDPYPRRGRENGATPDMTIILFENATHKDQICNSQTSGYKIYVQHPADLPHASLYYYAALPNQVSSLALKFNMISTSNSLKLYTPEVRQCYFPPDRQLRYFKIYTADNCRLECQSNFTFKSCGCVAYYMPHDNSNAICTKFQDDCVVKAKNTLATEEMQADLGIQSGACRCLPACDSVQYDAEILKTKYDPHEIINYLSNVEKLNFPNYTGEFSRIDIYFKEPRFVSMRRSELFGMTDFFANIGGLLGLFLGFSFLSLVEIIYFLTLRLWCTLNRDLKKEKAERRDSKKGIE